MSGDRHDGSGGGDRKRDRDRERDRDDGHAREGARRVDHGGGEQEEPGERWDADDERRQHDQMAPPKEPCECYCLHCGRVFMSDQMWFQRVKGDRHGFEGFWMCPTPNCGGAGFTFDIFPTDPSHPANDGWVYDDDDEDDDGEGEEVPWEDDDDDDGADAAGDAGQADGEWDPAESKYKALDEAFGGADDDDIEGEEWKYGLAPGERPAEPPWAEAARREWEEQQKKYDEPDERPREVDWTDRDDGPRGDSLNEDDIPF